MITNFPHLHLHTDASKDGVGRVSRLLDHAKSLGMSAIACTDHGTLANSVSFTLECLQRKIKPILGNEIYIMNPYTQQIGHLTILASGKVGWNNLVLLNNRLHANQAGHYVTFQDLYDLNEGLIVLSGCIASPFHTLPELQAIELAAQVRAVFGERFYAEYMALGANPNWKKIRGLAETIGMTGVLTNDVHFPFSDDAEIQTWQTKMRAGYSYDNADLYLKTEDEMYNSCLNHGMTHELTQELIANTKSLAESIEEIALASEQRLPQIENDFEKLNKLAIDGFVRKLNSGEIPKSMKEEYKARAMFELNVISKMGYSAYFLILLDILNNAKSNNVKIGPGRGSGAGSIVLWLIGITDVDSIKHGLQFERFLNPERKGMPDVDVDIASQGRDVVLEYANKIYGALPISTYSRLSHKILINDLARYFKIPDDVKTVVGEKGAESEEFKNLIARRPEVGRAYNAMYGAIRHKGIHAGGVVITSQTIPVEKSGDKLAVAWTEGANNELSYAGLVKFDLLGLNALDALQKLEELIGRKPPIIPEDDAEEFSIFKTGRLEGIFQFAGSPGIRDLTINVHPRNFIDLYAITALFRPGAIDAGHAFDYPKFKNNPRKIHPLIDGILEDTYGIIVFQEQVMSIVQIALNGTLAEADLARRVITKSGKKLDDPIERKKFLDLKKRVIDGFISKGMKLQDAENVWDEIATHSRYSFNKSHSVAYTMISWQMAWYKYHYPSVFYAVMLEIDKANSQEYISAAQRDKIQVVLPHVNFSNATEWAYNRDSLFMPLVSVKFLGDVPAELIVREREENGKYRTISDFVERTTKKVVRAQARRGLFYLKGFYGVNGKFEDLDLGKKEIFDEKKFGAKPNEATIRGQIEHLGFIIPPAGIQLKMKHLKSKGYTVGVVDNTKFKTKGRREYYVIYLSPSGIAWMSKEEFEQEKLQKHDIIAMTKTSYGKVAGLQKIWTVE